MFSLPTAHSGADSRQSQGNKSGKPGESRSHDQWRGCWRRRACLQMAPCSLCFGVLKVDFSTSVRSSRQDGGTALYCRWSDSSYYGYSGRWSGKKRLKKTCLERRGMPMTMVVTLTIQNKALRRWTNPVHRGAGCEVVGENCDVVVVVDVVRGQGNKHKVSLMNE